MPEVFTLIAVLFAVAFVIYISYLFSKYISKTPSRINAAKHMKVIDRLVVGQDRYILIVKIQNEVFLVSVTQQSIQILKELESDDFDDALLEEKKGSFEESFKTILQNIFKPKK